VLLSVPWLVTATCANQQLDFEKAHINAVDMDQQPISTEFSFQTCLCVMQATLVEELLEVQQVNQINTSASVGLLNSHLDLLRPAIQGYGGSVEVLAVDDGICQVTKPLRL